MGGAMLSNSLIQFSVNGQGCVTSLLFDLKSNYGRDNEDYENEKVMKCCNYSFFFKKEREKIKVG